MFFKRNRSRGQNTAEYLVLLVLVAAGSVSVFTVFGTSIKKQMANVVERIEGKAPASANAVNSDLTKIREKGSDMDLTHD